MKLISLYTHLSRVGGANNMCVNLHHALMQTNYFQEGKVSSLSSYDILAANYKKSLSEDEYCKFNLIKILKHSDSCVFISHHRKITSMLVLGAKALRKNIKLIHIAHTTSNKLGFATFFPKHVVAISKGVKKNLESYFGIKNSRVIYNGSPIPTKICDKDYNPNDIIVTMPATIYDLKQQLVVTRYLKNKLPAEITIQFAGDGPDREELEQLIKNDTQFKVLGHIDDMENLYCQSDYVMLFSKIEGLPLSLIEAQSYGRPIICNDVGGNLEILNPNINGFFTNNLSDLLLCLQELPKVENTQYQKMKEKSLKNFNENFQFDKMVSQYFDLIKEVIHSKF